MDTSETNGIIVILNAVKDDNIPRTDITSNKR